jgi:glycosyltransferase involved in cell wall biosynthesis
MEAMALRRPVITTCIAGIPELVLHGETGWLVPAGSIHDLANAIRDMLKRPVSQLAQMGEAGYRRVLRRHDVDVEAAKLADLFLLSTRTGAAT